jgi:hypothetical protein
MLRRQPAMTFIPLPYLLAKEKVVVRYFPLERIGRDAEVGISMAEVVVVTRVLVLQTAPAGVVEVAEHRVFHVLVGFLEPFDA